MLNANRRIFSEEHRNKLSIAAMNRSEEHKKNISLALKGRTMSSEWKRKMSIARTGNKHSDETKKKMSIAQKGHKVTDETKKKISIANSGKKRSDECKKKISISHMGCRTDGYCNAWGDDEFKKDCRKNFCEICGTKKEVKKIAYRRNLKTIITPNSNLILHHINLDPKDCRPDNLQTLCVSCHATLHNKSRNKGRKKLSC